MPRPQNNNNKTYSTKSRSKAANRNGQQQQKRKNIPKDPQGRLVVMVPQMFSTTVLRRFAQNRPISSDASGVIATTARGGADLIASLAAEFSNFSQEYTEFRILKLGYYFAPSTTSATSTTGPYQGILLTAPWAQLKPTTSTSGFQSNQLVKFSTLEEKEIIVNRPNSANHSLWNPVGTALPIDRDFGLFYFPIGALAVSSIIFQEIEEMWCEFRTPA